MHERLAVDAHPSAATVAVASSGSLRVLHNGSPPLTDLVAADGTPWLEFRKTLVPDYAKAWREIAFTYLMVFAGYAAHIALSVRWLRAQSNAPVAATSLGVGVRALLHPGPGLVLSLLAAPLATLWIGFWLHAVNQFAHDGSHGNLLADRKRNDMLSDWLLWPLFAQSVRSYRKSHMQHHTHLGDHLDTEINYHECMNPWFFFKALTGIQLTLMLVRYLVKPKTLTPAIAETGNNAFASDQEKMLVLARAMVLHGTLIAVPLAFGLYGSALAWLLAVAVVYPSIGTARQILEHRASDAVCAIDFAQVVHGPVNRLFGDDLFSRWFGAAGLNRHMLHHWDPGISYTRLPDMEAFVLRTPYARWIHENRTTYARATVTMVRTALRG